MRQLVMEMFMYEEYCNGVLNSQCVTSYKSVFNRFANIVNYVVNESLTVDEFSIYLRDDKKHSYNINIIYRDDNKVVSYLFVLHLAGKDMDALMDKMQSYLL